MAWTYDLATLHTQVRDMLSPTARFCLTFEIWSGGAMGLDVQVTIYHDGEFFSAATPEAALVKLRQAYQVQPAMEAADLGVVVLPRSE